MDLKDYLENLGITPRKASTADGGEYSSSCPACGDGGKGLRSDRFRIWPQRRMMVVCVKAAFGVGVAVYREILSSFCNNFTIWISTRRVNH